MSSGLSSNELIALSEIAGVALAIGAGIGRKWGTTRKHKEAEDNALQQLTWAVGGKPADEWNHERTPGVIEQITTLRDDHNKFEINTAAMFEKLLARAERSEESVKVATAVAAKAVLDTAQTVAADKKEADALAAAELIATALATKLGLGESKLARANRAVKPKETA